MMNGIGQRLIFKIQPEVEKKIIFYFNARFQAGGWARKRSSLTRDLGAYKINLERRNI